MKHNLLKSVILSVILLMGVSNAWAWTSRQTGTISSVYVTGSMNSWNTNDQNWKLSSIDGNHWKGTFYLKGQSSNYTFKLYINATNRNDYYSTGYNYHKDWTGGEAPIYTDKGNASITPRTTTTTKYIKVEIDFYASYGNDDHGYLSVTQTDVSDLSPSLDATSTALIAEGTSTLTASCSGGSGGYTYSYKVTCDGSDVTNSTLNTTSGSSVKFTAPTVTGKKTYTITVTAKDSHALLSGLATKTATKTITVEEAHNVTISYKCGSTTVKNNTTTNNVKFETKSTITAPDIPGYKFANWTLGTGIASSDATTANPIKITTKSSENHTLTANYTENTFVVRGGVKFGDTWSKDTHVMTKKNASEKIVYYTITLDGTNNINDVSNSQFQFKIYEKECDKWYGLTADGDQYWYTRGLGQLNLDGNGKNIEIRADVKGDYEIKVDYSDPNSSPKITVTYPQKSYYLSGSWDDWKGEYPIENTSVTIHLEKGDHSFLIFDYQAGAKYYGNIGKMERTNCSGWPMTDGAGNCRIDADITGDYTFTFDASTKKLTVLYPMLVTLGSSKFGPYGIKYNGQSYFSKETEDVVIGIPKGATINFIEGQPYSDLYTGDIMIKNVKRNLPLNDPYIIEGTVRFDANYVTKVAQVAYLGVPNNDCDWDKTTTAANANFIWRFDSYSSFPMTNSNDKAELAFQEDGVKYYKFTIPAGCNKFQIQRKQARNDDENNQNETFSHTCDHEYMVLNTGINCYMLDNGTFNKNTHTGHWCALPPQSGDYRLLYVEQVVEKDANNNTVVTRKKAHPSDVVRASELNAQGTIVSLHVYKDRKYQANLGGGGTYESSSNPEIILQKYNGNDQWVDEECHMVFGPLETLPSMGMLPGRKNASVGSDKDDFVYDNGIDIIKNDTHKYQGSGVWNFYIIKNGTKVTLDLNKTVRYEGNYYIRTKAADGGWNSYTYSDNHMPYSTYADDNNFFTHYYCKYIQGGTDVSFVVANDYAQVITHDSLYVDRDFYGNYYETPIVGDKTLPAENANVRFSWDEETNITSRAYIAGSFGGDNEFLVVKNQDNKVTLQNNNNNQLGYFNDNTNWLYYADVLAKPQAKAQVVAKYNKINQYFMGEKSGDNQYEQLIGGTQNDTEYPIRILYEFPEHRFVVAYVPPTTITGDVAIETPVMLIRENHEAPNQITFSDNAKKITAPLPAYGTITFTEDHLKDNTKTEYARALYWISFPFDVKISDAFGIGKYGEDWIIEYYDGKKRSEIGLTVRNTFWEYNWSTDYILEAGKGYVLCLDLDRVNSMFLDGNNDKEKISLYFPSMENIAWGDIKMQGEKTVNIPEWKNNATKEKDHNWNLIGVISYANTGESTQQSNTNFLYEYDASSDTYNARTSSGYTFNALHAYMVQYGGDISWTSHIAPQAIAAKHNTYGTSDKYILCLDLINKGKTTDQTFIQLQEEEATAMFDLNQDMMKIFNSGANIYSIANTNNGPYELAGNALPIEETIIPLGVQVKTAGEYTFAMPDGTGGITAELIDYQTNTRTNLLLSDYTVNLTAGTNDTRFALHVKPDKTATNVENITTPSCSDVRKFIIDGVLYMQKDGILYDAQGHIVR